MYEELHIWLQSVFGNCEWLLYPFAQASWVLFISVSIIVNMQIWPELDI